MYFGTVWMVWVQKKCALKSSSDTFSIYISRKISMKHSLRILKNKNLFKRHNYPSPNALNIKHFWTICYNHWGVWVSLIYLILNFKKTACSKNNCMRHWLPKFFSEMCSVFHLMTSWHLNIWKVKVWLSPERKGCSKWNKKKFCFKVLSLRHTKLAKM